MIALTPGAACVVAIAAVACVYDLRERRIPNWLTFGGAAVALVFSAWTGGPSALGWAVAGWFVGCALFFPFFALGGMGAGDVKLVAAFGAWLGPGLAVWTALYAGVAGGVLAIVVAAWRGYLRQALTNVWALLGFWRLAGIQPLPGLTLRTAEGPRLPYALPIAAGAVLVLWLR